MLKKSYYLIIIAMISLFLSGSAAGLEVCVAPDNGGSTNLPANCPYTHPSDQPFVITDGLPPGTTIEIEAYFDDFDCYNPPCSEGPPNPGTCEGPGGTLGGDFHCFNAVMYMDISGTGGLLGFNRNIAMQVNFEVYTAPRTWGDPEQVFDGEVIFIYGQQFGDPDFCEFIFMSGSNHGFPGDGQFTISEVGDGTYYVESFFDITYIIEFEGCPGSILESYGGTTVGTTRIMQGGGSIWEPGDPHKMHFPQLPDEDGWNVFASGDLRLADDWECSSSGPVSDIHFWGSWLGGNEGTITSFMITIFDDIPDPSPGDPSTHSMPGEILWSREISYNDVTPVHIEPGIWEGWHNPLTGTYAPGDHDNYYQYNISGIADPFMQTEGETYWLSVKPVVEEAQLRLWGWKSTENHWNDDAVFGTPGCVVPDNGAGTVDLPADCPYTTPDDDPFMIYDGLPPGTSIELDATFTDFVCTDLNYCSTVPPPGKCETPGGILGGNIHCFDATVQMKATGTGDLTGFSRTIWLQAEFEIHTGPRTPGDSLQEFPAELVRCYGEMFGDPDFCELIFYAGTDYGLPSPGQFTIYELDPAAWVESFFDVTYQIQFQGCPGSILEDLAGTTTGTSRITQGSPVDWAELFEPPVSDPISNGFMVEIGPSGELMAGAGEDAFGDGWYFYPMESWWNVWFYDHPYDPSRYKTFHIEFDIIPTGPQSYAEIAINWSTDLWSLDQPPLDSAPPLPGVNEAMYIGRHTVLAMPEPTGHFMFDFTIPDYNPEWVSVDVRGNSFVIPEGFIIHECIGTEMESMDLAFVITGDAGECDCIPGEANGNGTLNILDITYLISYLYKGGSAPSPYALCSGDSDCNCTVNILDITYLISFLYKGGSAPCTCQQWLSSCGPPLRK